MKQFGIVLLCLACMTCAESNKPATNAASERPRDARVAQLSKTKTALAKFYQPMKEQEGDWLQSHPENGETFEEYVDSSPTLPTADRKTIYIQPVGAFSADQLRVIRLTAEYMEAFYNLPVILQAPRAIGKVPTDMERLQYPDNRQIRTSFFLDDLLPKLLPNDAAALICLTNLDLYPEETWNYVFGQASLEKRVGVWSLRRLERTDGKKAPPDIFLDRTLKVAMHETGHMFSMRHCIKYECLMSGTNHLDETDRRPLDTCPECTMKIAWAMNYPPGDRYKKLAQFWRKQGRPNEQKRMLDKAAAVDHGK
ncbi:MAG TPA: archaemetzincin [Pyrinomonadaceae bacterium]|nr:archaemetzincin [Pyrinomonadaceae bacterium]